MVKLQRALIGVFLLAFVVMSTAVLIFIIKGGETGGMDDEEDMNMGDHGHMEESSKNMVLVTYELSAVVGAGWQGLIRDSDPVEAVRGALSVCEVDPSMCNDRIGYGTNANKFGQTRLEATVMDGTRRATGTVAQMPSVKEVTGVAVALMKSQQSSILVDQAAVDFAAQRSFAAENVTTPASIDQWNAWRTDGSIPRSRLEGVGVLVMQEEGPMAAAISGSGYPLAPAGRLGLAAVPGAGAYADDKIGAAVAVGDGDIAVHYLPAFAAVQALQQSPNDPQTACQTVLAAATQPPHQAAALALLLLTPHGAHAACYSSSFSPPFVYSLRSPDSLEIQTFSAKLK